MDGVYGYSIWLASTSNNLLDMPKLLIDLSDAVTKSDLGIGYAVGSQQITKVDEFQIEDIPSISCEIQQAILLFDLWLQNEDRTLSTFGGNPNLLYHQESGKLYAIDYNLISPAHFDEELFWATHVFRDALRFVDLGSGGRQVYEQRMQQALNILLPALKQLSETCLEKNETTAAFDFKNMLLESTNKCNTLTRKDFERRQTT